VTAPDATRTPTGPELDRLWQAYQEWRRGLVMQKLARVRRHGKGGGL
jgi:hypothetical protein